MSYLSSSENVGFSGIPQSISETSCATQYKMAVDSVPGACKSDMNIFIHDSSGDEQTYLPHFSDNFFHTKFKIDSNDLYTFNDSDVVAGEITVGHTEENFVFPDNVDVKTKYLESPNKEIDLLQCISNGDVKDDKINLKNGHYSPLQLNQSSINETKKSNVKIQKIKVQNHVNADLLRSIKGPDVSRSGLHSPKSQTILPPSSEAGVNNGLINNDKNVSSKLNQETFLDVFKREQGLCELASPSVEIKTEPQTITPVKAGAKKQAVKSSQPKSKRGRGPTVHESLQRIPSQRRALAVPNHIWHAPGEDLFNCGPLDDKKPNAFRQLESSSSDDDNMPEFESGFGAMCVEESAAESRGARLELRRAAMRRHVARIATSLNLTKGHKVQHTLATLIKKQINTHNASGRLSTTTTNHLLAMRGMTSLLSVKERRKLRESGWSGGESGRSKETADICAEERCLKPPVPCGRHCLSHVTHAPEQRLYAACAAVFAGGDRCKQPLLPLQDQTPLCAEHAWKRDNYEMLARESKPAKCVRKRTWTGESRPRPRRPKRRRRLVPRRASPPRARLPPPPTHEHSLAEINVCSNSSTYDSSEDTAVGALSESEYMSANNSHELEVGQVPPDDILDPSVLGQMPDEAFTEFFNTAEGGSSFAESSELAAALEAVLDERVLDERALDIADVFVAQHAQQKNKIQVLAPVEMSSSAPS
ncbi:uncharacterized protein LOC121726487 [Aricia agestis]|uniref:uncharacterized protein LOC121726487 n=1 Tax=Aricia agestis TaxID=91739 RepID=UPI001C20B0FD|nr:uncharacterized protein LOC121726487 [Aricia agestis]